MANRIGCHVFADIEYLEGIAQVLVRVTVDGIEYIRVGASGRDGVFMRISESTHPRLAIEDELFVFVNEQSMVRWGRDDSFAR